MLIQTNAESLIFRWLQHFTEQTSLWFGPSKLQTCGEFSINQSDKITTVSESLKSDTLKFLKSPKRLKSSPISSIIQNLKI